MPFGKREGENLSYVIVLYIPVGRVPAAAPGLRPWASFGEPWTFGSALGRSRRPLADHVRVSFRNSACAYFFLADCLVG